MFVNDNFDADTLGCRLSPRHYRGTVNSPIELWAVNHIAKRSYLVERKSDFGPTSSAN